MQVTSGANSRHFQPSLLSHITHLQPLIPTAHHGTGRGINSTAGAKTEFDGPSRESGTYWIHVVSAPLTMEIGINRGMDPMEARARSDMDGTSSRPRPSIRSITIQPVYGICMQWNSRCNIVLSVQNELLMIVSMRQNIWFPVSFAGSSCYYVVIGSPTLPMASDRFMWFPSLNGPHFLSTIFFPHFFFFFLWGGHFCGYPIMWRSHKCAWSISDYIIYVNRFQGA